MTSNNSSFISETLRQLDELNAETYLSAADQRYNQAERLEMMADAATNQADKAALLAAARGLYGKMDKLQARADTKDHQWRDPAPSQLDELSPGTYGSAAFKRGKQYSALDDMSTMQGFSKDKDKINAAKEIARAKFKKLQDKENDSWKQEALKSSLTKAGLDPNKSALLRKAGLGSAAPGPRHTPDELDESKVFRIYRNSDQSATVVMESGVAVWLAPKSVNKVLSESGNINRTKLHRLLESRIWK